MLHYISLSLEVPFATIQSGQPAFADGGKMTTPPTVKTPPYRPTTPSSPLLPNLVTPWSTPCHFTLPTFLHVLKDLTLHPERNSSLILRADPIPLDTQSRIKSSQGIDPEDAEFEEWLEKEGMECVEEIRVRLMPKQPKRDGKLDQRVVFYRSKESVIGHEDGERVEQGVVVMIPMVKEVGEIPFFHPPVKKLMFYYETQKPGPGDEIVEDMKNLSTSDTDTKPDASEEAATETEPDIQGRISISYAPLPSTSGSPATTPENPMLGIRRTSLPRKRSPLAGPPDDVSLENVKEKEDPKVTQARLDRTCLALLERVYKHGFGQMVGYQKRVHHDVCLSPPTYTELM